MKKIKTNGSNGVVEFVKDLKDQAPGTFEIVNKEHPEMSAKTGDYYYVVRLEGGKTAILQAGILVQRHEKTGGVFVSDPIPGEEVELADGVRLGVKSGRWVVATA